MKKTIILAGLLLAVMHTAFAEQRVAYLKYQRKNIPESEKDVSRVPMRMPIDVVYDTDTYKIEINGNTSIDAEVFLYNEDDIIEDYSSSLNTNFVVPASGIYIIRIEGDGWYAEGEIEV